MRRVSLGLGSMRVPGRRGVEVDIPVVQDALFMRRTYQVIAFLRMQVGGFFDVVMNLFPY